MTGCDESMLRRVGQLVSDPPPFDLVKGHARMFKSRAALLEKGLADWALGESMAYGTLLMEGHHVRLSGQDAQRGTFSHRHHVINDPNQDGVRHPSSSKSVTSLFIACIFCRVFRTLSCL